MAAGGARASAALLAACEELVHEARALRSSLEARSP
jgi:hypothetical protein